MKPQMNSRKFKIMPARIVETDASGSTGRFAISHMQKPLLKAGLGFSDWASAKLLRSGHLAPWSLPIGSFWMHRVPARNPEYPFPPSRTAGHDSSARVLRHGANRRSNPCMRRLHEVFQRNWRFPEAKLEVGFFGPQSKQRQRVFGMEADHGGDNVERNGLHVTVGMLFARKNLGARSCT
jgi:hypothetical protein